jgi:hypothetical protein
MALSALHTWWSQEQTLRPQLNASMAKCILEHLYDIPTDIRKKAL